MSRLACLLVLAGCCSSPDEADEYDPHGSDDSFFTDDDPVRLSFAAPGWRFYRAYGRHVGLPRDAFLRLFAVREGREGVRFLVRRPPQLRGKVRVQTAKQALEFVRLFTNKETRWLFEGHGFFEVGVSDSDPGPEQLSMVEFRELGLARPHVSVVDGRFLVERPLGQGRAHGHADVYVVSESVSENGEHVFVSKRLVRRNVNIFYRELMW